MILNKHKNKIFKVLQEQGLNPSQFSCEDLDCFYVKKTHPALKLKFKGSELYFIIGQSDFSFDRFFTIQTEYSPDFQKKRDKLKAQNLQLLDVINEFIQWIEEDVKEYLKEIDTPNLWETYEKSIQPLNLENIDFEDDSNFNDEEKEHIKIDLNEIKILIAENFDFSKTQLKIIDQRLNYLEEATNRLNKTDWKGVAISTVFSMIINLGVDTQTGQTIIDLFKKVFENLPHLPL